MIKRTLAVLGTFAIAACTHPDVDGPATVDAFDVERYLGHWHQVAFIPNRFQEQCIGGATAEYARVDDDRIAVVNACETKDGIERVEGMARFTAAPEEGKLEVAFVEVAGLWLWLAAGDYWVMDVGPNYGWALVGHPRREYGWILARQPELDDASLVQFAKRLEARGYDPCRFVVTTPDRPRDPLCEVT